MATNAPETKVQNKKKVSRFFNEVRNELKKVIWPTREQLVNNTVTVLLCCLAGGVIIWVVDLALTQLIRVTLGT